MVRRYTSFLPHLCGWLKHRFKLRLHPNGFVSNKIPRISRELPPIVDIFADFLRYLYQCARNFIEETHADGVDLWSSLEDRIEFVLSHPNGWEGDQQSKMRTAAVRAGLISDDENGHSHLSFVTEGEASLHFCLQSGLTNDAIKVGFIQSFFLKKYRWHPGCRVAKDFLLSMLEVAP